MSNIQEVICSESLTVDEYKIIMSKIWDSRRFGRLSKNRNLAGRSNMLVQIGI